MKQTKKLIAALILLLLITVLAFLILKTCNNRMIDKSGFYEQTSKTSQSSKSSKSSTTIKKSSSSSATDSNLANSSSKTSVKAATENGGQTSGNDTSVSQQSATTPAQSTSEPDQIISDSINKLANGDFSSIVGTWNNDLGESITVGSDGKVTNNTSGNIYSVSMNTVDSNVYFGSLSGTNQTDSSSFLVIPAGTEDPHIGGTAQADRIVVGQDINGDYHPFYRN